MNEEKRNCVFTGLPAECKLIVSSKKHNWTKAVPCTKKYKELKEKQPITEKEFKLIELFIQKELALLRVEFFENKMEEIRLLLNSEYKFDFKNEDIDLLDIEPVKTITLTPEKNESMIKEEENEDFWNVK